MPKAVPVLPVSLQLWCKHDRVLASSTWKNGARIRRTLAPPFPPLLHILFLPPPDTSLTSQSTLSIRSESTIILSGNQFQPASTNDYLQRENFTWQSPSDK